MDKKTRQRLEKAGFVVTDTKDFLGLTEEEDRLIRARVALAQAVRELRKRRHITQAQLAKAMRSTQARVAKIEAGSPEVSVDLMIRAMFALGTSLEDLGEVFQSA
jgi:DNA-binding XRE family transcriptional regulator